MRVSRMSQGLLCVAVMALLLGWGAVVRLPFAFGQTQPEAERFWVAGRYDGNRVIVYFDSAYFDNKVPADKQAIAQAVTFGFFDPFEVSARDIAQLPKQKDAEQFALGDQYDLLPGNGVVTQVTLTTLVADEGDEETGNDSYIGALATEKRPNDLLFAKNYYAVRRHKEPDPATQKPPFKRVTSYAGLSDEPAPFEVQTRIVSLVTQSAMAMATALQKSRMRGDSPAVAVQSFRVAGGELRYYARAEWNSGRQWHGIPLPDYALGAWLTAEPALKILATEKITGGTGFDGELPELLNIVDLADGATGAILLISRGDGVALKLVEYRDGADVTDMRVLQSIAAGE